MEIRPIIVGRKYPEGEHILETNLFNVAAQTNQWNDCAENVFKVLLLRFLVVFGQSSFEKHMITPIIITVY